MAGYLGTKAVFLSTTAAGVTGNSTIGGDLTVDNNTLYVDSTNNRVGIGTSSPSQPLSVVTSSGAAYIYSDNGTANTYIGSDGSNTALFGTSTNHDTRFMTNNTERMRIDSSGNLLVGTTDTTLYNNTSGDGLCYRSGASLDVTAASDNCLILNRNTTDGGIAEFRKSGSIVGSISVTGSSTAYNTSSDYRLKEDVQPMTGASDRVLALNPVNFAWKADGSRVDGFLAHEAQAVVPEAVIGSKDAVDADGNPVYQGIDQSKLVPLLTAALQEALTEIADLKARVTALETV